MSNWQYDAIFIGGGASGRFGSSFLRALGGRQLILEKGDHLGGKCCKEACVPQHLIYDNTAEVDQWRWFSGMMWYPRFEDIHPDGKLKILPVLETFLKGRPSVYKFMTDQSAQQLGLEFKLFTEARIIDEHTVEADGQKHTARCLIIASGSRPHMPAVPGIDLKGVLNYSSMITLDYEPQKVVVVGASKIGTPYACFFNAFGCDTTLVDMVKPFYPNLDDDVREFVISNMKRRGLKTLEGARLVRIKGTGRVEAVEFEVDGQEREIPCDTVLIATGVVPNSEIAAPLGVKTGRFNEIVVNKKFQTSVPGVYAVGDVNGPPYEMSKARMSGMVAAQNVMGEDAEFTDRIMPEFMHTTYEVCWVGLTEKQAREKYKNVVVINMPPANLDIPLPLGERTMNFSHIYPEMSGFHKAIIDGDSRRFVGFHHVGYGAKDGFQYLAVLLEEGLTVDKIATFHELFVNPTHFIQLSRLRAGQKNLTSL